MKKLLILLLLVLIPLIALAGETSTFRDWKVLNGYLTPANNLLLGISTKKVCYPDLTCQTTAATGGGSGDVVGPATNTADFIPQWNGANSKTLKNGLAVPAGGLAGITALNTKLTANGPITGGTATKVTFDANGLVTSGANATTADIATSSNKLYITNSQQTVLNNTSGTNTGDNATNSQYSGLATSKQDALTLTTTGSTGASTLVGATLNIPVYAGSGGGTPPGGSNKQIQFNDGGSFAGSSNMTFDKNDGGQLSLRSSDGTVNGGTIDFRGGDGVVDGGSFFMVGGAATSYGGGAYFSGGTGQVGGNVAVSGGDGNVTGGDAYIYAGAGSYYGGNVILTNGAGTDNIDGIYYFTFGGATSGYTVDDIITVSSGNGDATFKVTIVGGTGDVVGLIVINPGTGYSVGGPYFTTGGTGTGLQVTVDSIRTTGAGNVIIKDGISSGQVNLDTTLLTPATTRTQKLPDKDGTFAMTSDITSPTVVTSTIDHNALANLNVGDYKHLTNLQFTTSTTPASGSANGYLKSTDWTTFNSKEPAVTKGNLTAGSTKISIGGTGTGAVIGAGASIDIGTLNIADLSDVTIATPTSSQILTYNGTKWVNGNAQTVNAGSGVDFFPLDVSITPSGTQNANKIDTLSKTPGLGAPVTDSAVVNNNTLFIESYLYNTSIGGTSIDAGVWMFDIYASASSLTGTSQILENVYRVRPNTGTVTMTGSGTSRTATASAGTPFALVAIDTGGTLDSDSYLQTPNGLYRITARTSDTVVTIATPSTYTNESAVAGNVWKRLFQVASGAIPTTTISPITVNSVQPAYTIQATDKLASTFFATTTRVTNTTVSYTHGGSTQYTHFNSPLVIRHNDLSGLQGGAGGEYYHLTALQATTSTQPATGSQDGYLSKGDWTTFNGKQNTITNPVTGTGTTNELPYWASASSLGTLPVATYPSLTELSYSKGVTSAIQTQLNGKQATGSYLTGNQTITLGGILSGSGATSITASAGSGYYMPSTTDQTNWNAKQAALVSGTNIKTVNGNSLLGSGNVVISGSGVQIPTYIVAASGGDFTTIQGALDACATAGGATIYLADAVYNQAGTGLLWKGSNCNIYGRTATTTINFTGATTLFKTNSAVGLYENNGVHGVVISGDGNANSVAINGSDMGHCTYENIIIDNIATGIVLNDTQNITFYNNFRDISITTLSKFGINMQSTTPTNDNIFTDVFTGCSSANCIGVQIRNGNNNKFYGFRAEPSTTSGTVGVKLFDAATGDGTFDNQFYGSYIEANATGILVAATLGSGGGVARNSFISGIADANTADISDSGTDTAFINFDNNFTVLNKLSGFARNDGANTFSGVQNITNLTLPTNGQILLTVPTSNAQATGPTTNAFNAGYTSTAVGDLVYLDSSATWQKANAGSTSALYSSLLGIALEVKASGNALKVALPGSFIYSTTFPTLTVGAPVYMSTTAGAVQVAQPTATDQAIRVVGYAVNAAKMYFNPSSDYIIHN